LARIIVPGLDIFGEGYHPTSAFNAQIGACLDFKKRAEASHDGKRMLVKNVSTLTSKTGAKFLQYCKMSQRDWEEYSFVCKNASRNEIAGKLFLGGRLLSECTMYKYVSPKCLMVVKKMLRIYVIILRRGI
jgi:hypothetical protein